MYTAHCSIHDGYGTNLEFEVRFKIIRRFSLTISYRKEIHCAGILKSWPIQKQFFIENQEKISKIVEKTDKYTTKTPKMPLIIGNIN